MSFLGGLFGGNEPDERFVDDQSTQNDCRDNQYVGHVVEQACTVYDTLFRALEYTIKGRANALENLDGVVTKLEARCAAIVAQFKGILAKMAEATASGSISLSVSAAKDALAILNGNPVLRRYIGEANYWALWDLLATMSGQGVETGADITANIRGAIKGSIYVLLSMTNGMMHFESYIAQITQFWGWLYMKEISLPLTDSICPQVTCQYYYKKPMDGNPIPGPLNYAPMPFPIFDLENYSWDYAVRRFRYDTPDTWNVLTAASRGQMRRAYNYWKSNYTDAVNANTLMANAASVMTGGTFTGGFGPRNKDYPGGAPLRVGATFHQLDTDYGESFPVRLVSDDLGEAYAAVDAAVKAFVAKLADPDLEARRDAAILEATVSEEYPQGATEYTGEWLPAPYWNEPDALAAAAGGACAAVVANVREFKEYVAALAKLAEVYRKQDETYAPYVTPSPSHGIGDSPLVRHLIALFGGLAEDSALSELKGVIAAYGANHNMGAPYAIYSPEPGPIVAYTCAIQWRDSGLDPLYTAGSNALSSEVDADEELGRKVDGGREPLFAALGIYGDLKGLYPWEYEIVPLASFRSAYSKIRSSFHIYYKKDDPSRVVFGDRIIQAGLLKYIAICKAADRDTITRGEESFTAYIFPSETCSIHAVPDDAKMAGRTWPSLESVQRVDAVDKVTGVRYMYDLMRNQIPRYPKYVDADKWSVMDLIHELWLLADALAPICGDGGERKAKLNDLLNQFGLRVRNGNGDGPLFIGQLPQSAGQGDMSGQGAHVELEFDAMASFAARIKAAVDAVYGARDEVLVALEEW